MDGKEELYAKWLSGEISDDELVSAEGPDALVEVKKIIHTVDQWKTKEYDTSKAYEKFKANHENQKPHNKKTKWIAGIGLLILLFLLAFFAYKKLVPNTLYIYASNNENKTTTLIDGSQVSLNDGSSIELNKSNWLENRIVELKGEAFFEVTKGNTFQVQTNNGSITVLGTKFNVRSRGPNLFVDCYEGKVQVVKDDQVTILSANESVKIIEGTMANKEVISDIAPSWQGGISKFENENIQLVFEEVERQYDIKIDSKVNDRNFTGNFNHNKLDDALSGICIPLGLEYTISEDQKSVVIE